MPLFGTLKTMPLQELMQWLGKTTLELYGTALPPMAELLRV